MSGLDTEGKRIARRLRYAAMREQLKKLAREEQVDDASRAVSRAAMELANAISHIEHEARLDTSREEQCAREQDVGSAAAMLINRYGRGAAAAAAEHSAEASPTHGDFWRRVVEELRLHAKGRSGR